MDQQAADTFSHIFNSDPRKSRLGLTATEDFNALKKSVVSIINKPSQYFIDLGILSFCRPTPPLLYPSDANEAMKLRREHATANIQNLQLLDEYICAICESMSVKLKNPVTCSLYISSPNGLSFDFHTDEWEGLSVQIFGEKTFLFMENNIVKSIDIAPGEWLRINPTDEHKAIAKETSLHLSFARHKKYSL